MTDAALLQHMNRLPHAKANFKQLVRETGVKLLELAKKMGIAGPDSGSSDAEAQIPETTIESVEKSAVFIEMKQKAETEKPVSDLDSPRFCPP